MTIEGAVEATHADGRRRHRRGRLVRRDRRRRCRRRTPGLRAQGRTAKLRPGAPRRRRVRRRGADDRGLGSPGRGWWRSGMPTASDGRAAGADRRPHGKATRRQADASLATELTRAERLGGAVRLIWATSTTSSSSTTGTGTQPEGSSCATSRGRCTRRSVRSTPLRDGEERSSRSSCPARISWARRSRRARPASAE